MERLPGPRGFLPHPLRARDAGSPARGRAGGRAGRGESALALEPPCRCRAKSVYGYL